MGTVTQPYGLSPQVSFVLVAFISIACYNVLELFFFIIDFFKRRHGLYFWSMLVTTCGILVTCIGFIVQGFKLAPPFGPGMAIFVGLFAMSSGSVFVVYSRLHLIVTNPRRVQWVFYMNVASIFILQIPVGTLFIIMQSGDRSVGEPEDIYEKIMTVGGCLQEFIIAGIYIKEALQNLKPVLAVKGPEGSKVITHLIVVNIITITMGIILIVLEWATSRYVKLIYTPFIYSVKMKIEFGILNKLIRLIETRPYLSHTVHWGSSGDHSCVHSNYPLFSKGRRGSERPQYGDVHVPPESQQEHAYHSIALAESSATVPTPARCYRRTILAPTGLTDVANQNESMIFVAKMERCSVDMTARQSP